MSRNISNYIVYKAAHELVLKVYAVTQSFPREEKFGLISQMRRSSASVPTNLAEGAARDSEAEFRYFVNIARGSLAEFKYQLFLCRDLHYISNDLFAELEKKTNDIGKMLTGLHQKLKAKS